MTEQRLQQVALNRLPQVGHATVRHLIGYLGSAEEVFRTKKGRLSRIPGIGDQLAAHIVSKSSFDEAESILKSCEKSDIRILHFTDEDFPPRLREQYDSPTLFYCQGNVDALLRRTIAIVGTRRASDYGKEITEKIVEEMRSLGVAIISGLAYGIDITAHRAALRANLPTYGVLASGLNRIYPREHWKTARDMQASGAIISENPPDTIPDARLFPARNRIIAALAEGTIVVEAAKKGGALITANIAHSYDKPVFAVPGNLNSAASAGTNDLIKQQKALIYTSIDDLMYHLNWETSPTKPSKHEAVGITLSPEERAIVEALKDQPSGVAIDDLAWKTQIQINQLASLLLTLEFNGMVKMLPGKKYLLQ